MTRLVGALLTLCVGALALADTRIPVSTRATTGECTTEILKQLERDWADAENVGDRDKIARIVADDWSGFENDGSKLTKEQLIARIDSGRVKASSVEFGPMEVKVLGDVAIVQGTVITRSAAGGKDTTRSQVWMDVFTKRDGKWVAVRSQSAQAETHSRLRWPI